MRAEDLKHEELLELDPDGGLIRFAGQRALLLDAVARQRRSPRSAAREFRHGLLEVTTRLREPVNLRRSGHTPHRASDSRDGRSSRCLTR